MSMIGKIVNRNGKLYVLVSDALWSEPTIIYRFWLIERSIANAYGFERPEEGDEVRYAGDGHWHVLNRLAGGVWTGDGSTPAAVVEKVSAPVPPARGKDLRWHEGRWQRLYKNGWRDAR